MIGLPVQRVVVLVLLAVIIPASSSNSTAQRTPVRLHDYDLLLLSEWTSDGQSVTAYRSEPASSQSIPLPFPTVSFSSAAADSPTNTLFLAGTNQNGTTLLTYLNVFTGESQILLNHQSAAVSDLVYWNNTLFWVENSTTLVSLKLDQPTPTAQVLLVAPDQFKIEGLTVDQHGTLYYTTWPPRTRTNSSIHRLELGASNSTTLASGLLLPHSLYYSSATRLLYYISNPPGIYFTVEQMNVTTGDHRTIMKQSHKHGGSLAVTCTGEVFWSDVVDKRLWKKHRTVGSKKVPGGSVVPVQGEANVLAVFASLECPDKFNLTDTVHPGSSSSEESGITSTPAAAQPPHTSTTTTTSTSTIPPPVTATIRLCSQDESESVGCSGGVCVFVSSPTCLSSPPPPQEELKQVGLHDPGAYAWPPYVIALISVLSTVATIMSLISVYMTVRVRTLSKKPIIRRRVVVSRSESSSTPTSVCEMIDIENCCNMNVCETPCYERTLLQPAASSNNSSSTTISVNSSNGTWGPCSSSTTKKDDKRCLLGR